MIGVSIDMSALRLEERQEVAQVDPPQRSNVCLKHQEHAQASQEGMALGNINAVALGSIITPPQGPQLQHQQQKTRRRDAEERMRCSARGNSLLLGLLTQEQNCNRRQKLVWGQEYLLELTLFPGSGCKASSASL